MTQPIYQRHPLSACFGDMDEDEFQHFKDDIEIHGQHEHVLVYDGMILDGWHRYLAVTQLGMELRKFTFTGTFEEAQERVVSSNDKRKHRTVAQRAQAIVAVTGCRPVGRPVKGNSAPRAELINVVVPSAKKLASAHGIGTRSIERARVIEAAGLGPIVVNGAMTAKEAELVATGKASEPAKPASKPEVARPQVEQDGMLTSDELMEQMQETQAENEQLQERVELMAKDDKAAEISKLLTRINGLEGRLHQAMNQIKASEDTTKVHAALIHKLRKLLGVEGHKAIYAAVSALVAERAEA